MRIQVNMMQNTAISFVMCVNDIDDKVDRFIEKVDDKFKVILDRGLELVTVRHYRDDLIESLNEGKIVMLEERLGNTVSMVMKKVPMMKRKI